MSESKIRQYGVPGLLLLTSLLAGTAQFLYLSSNDSAPEPEAAPQPTEISYTAFMKAAQEGRFIDNKATINTEVFPGVASKMEACATLAKPEDTEEVCTNISSNTDHMKTLEEAGIDVTLADPVVEESGIGQSAWRMLERTAPFVVLFSLFMLWQKLSEKKKRPGKLLDKSLKTVTFADVAGVEEAKEEMREMVDCLKDPAKYKQMGARIPKGALMVGPPGTGKTLMARAIAGEAGVPCYILSASDILDSVEKGSETKAITRLLEEAKAHKGPCIIFIDEIDALARKRDGMGNTSREDALNKLLTEMDGFESSEGVMLIAATNRPEVLDEALLRPGRFDRQITVGKPDVKGREAILKVHARNKHISKEVNFANVARGTPGFSGADLEGLLNEAAIMAVRQNKQEIMQAHIDAAFDNILAGRKRTLLMSEEERIATAYHEAGHAIVGNTLPANNKPLHKISIMPRGRALGLTTFLPEEEKHSETKREIKAQLARAMGGRIAEEIIFGKENVSTGASNDIEKATEIARQMVMIYGMDDNGDESVGTAKAFNDVAGLGTVAYGQPGQNVTQAYNALTGSVKEKVDLAVYKLMAEANKTAREILIKAKQDGSLHQLSNALLKEETLERAKITKIIGPQAANDNDGITAKIRELRDAGHLDAA